MNAYAAAEHYKDQQDDLEQQRIRQESEMQEIRDEVEKGFPTYAYEFASTFKVKGEAYGILFTDAAQDAYADFINTLVEIKTKEKYQLRQLGWE